MLLQALTVCGWGSPIVSGPRDDGPAACRPARRPLARRAQQLAPAPESVDRPVDRTTAEVVREQHFSPSEQTGPKATQTVAAITSQAVNLWAALIASA